MDNFPKILEPQVALLKADGNTGHVLTVDYSLYLSDDKEIFMVFEDLDSARKYIVDRRPIDTEIDFSIFNDKEELVEFKRALKWDKTAK